MFITDVLNYFSWGYLFQEKSYTSGETLIREMSQHAPCKTLIEEAQSVIKELGLSALEVRLEPTESGFDAELDKNVIIIKPNLSAATQRDCFVFELTNLIHYKKHREIQKGGQKGVYKNAEEFARAHEFIEYLGEIRCKTVSQNINKQQGRFFRPYMKNQYKYIPLKTMGFNLYYFLYNNSHREYFRQRWREMNGIKTPPNGTFNNALKIACGVSVVAVAIFLKWGIGFKISNWT